MTFALARTAREDHDETSFNLLMGYLEKISATEPEWRSRWFYEKCLFHIFRFEYQQAQNVLDNWPSQSSLDFWEIKRASIYAELGDLREAERIAEVALNRIRSRQEPYVLDYSLFSQESWAMYLLQMIKENQIPDRGSWFSQYRDRWSQLETFRCNPHEEVDGLAEMIDRVPVLPAPVKETRQAFYPRTITNTYCFSNQELWSSALPAFNLLRMLENSGVPCRCELSVPHHSVQKAAQWINPYAPLWSVTTVMRSNAKQVLIDSFFTFTYLTAFPLEKINYLYSRLYNFISQYSTSSSRNSFPTKYFEIEKLRLAIELISRLCIRLENDKLKQLFDIAVGFYKNGVFLDQILWKSIDKLFQGIFYSSSYSDIFSLLPELIALPVAGDRGFEVTQPNGFPEPFMHIELSQDASNVNNFDENISDSIKYLIQLIWNSNIETRSRSISRVLCLYQAGLLNHDDQNIFVNAVWNQLSPDSQLPADKYRCEWVFLSFPEREVGEVQQKLRDFLLSQENIDPINTNYFRNWIGSTRRPVMVRGVRVDWTLREVEQLLKKIQDWWNERRELILQYFGSDVDSFGRDIYCEALSQIIETISYVILPRIGDSESQFKGDIKSIIQELEKVNFCVIKALPMMLFITPEESDHVSQTMRAELTSVTDENIRDADLSLFYWLAYSNSHDLPTPSPDLLDIVVNRILFRHQPGLKSGLKWISNTLKEMPNQLSDEQLIRLCEALNYLLRETKLPTLFEFEMEISTRSSILVGDRPECQRLCSQLSYRLHQAFLQQGKDIPDILFQWKALSENSIFPEVRKVWGTAS